MIRFLRICLMLLLLTGVLVWGVGWTGTGLSLLLTTGQLMSGNALRSGEVQGSLIEGFTLHNVAYENEDVALRFSRLELAWKAKHLLDRKLQIDTFWLDGLEVRFRQLEEEASDGESESGQLELGNVHFPLPFEVNTLRLSNAQLLGPDFSEYLRVDILELAMSGEQATLDLRKLFLRSPGYDADLKGRFTLDTEWPLELAGHVVFRDFGVGPIAGDVEIAGPLAELEVKVDAKGPGYGNLTGKLLDLPHAFKWEADLDLHEVELHRAHNILPELYFDVRGHAYGEDLSYNGILTGKLDYLMFEDVECTIEFNGDEDKILFPLVTTENRFGRVELKDGLLSWKDDLLWRASLRTYSFDPAVVFEEYEGTIDADFFSSGSYGEISGLSFIFDFHQVEGTLNGYEAKAEGKFEVDPDGAKVAGLRVENGPSVLEFDGEITNQTGLINWQDAGQWKGALALSDFDPGIFFADYPGKIAGKVISEGNFVDGKPQGKILLDDLQGEVRGYQATGQGSARLDGQRVILENFQLTSGSGRIEASGETGDTSEVDLRVNVPDLGEMIAGATGTLQLEATLRGSWSDLQLKAKGEGGNLTFLDTRLDNLKIDIDGGVSPESEFTGALFASGFRTGDFNVDRADLSLYGKLEQHMFKGKISGMDGGVDFSGQGSYQNSGSWLGLIQGLDISHPLVGGWQLKSPAELNVHPDQLEVKTSCFTSGGEKLCLEGSYSLEADQWETRLTVDALQLQRFNGLLPDTFSLAGGLELDLEASGNLDEVVTAEGQVVVRQVSVGDEEGRSIHGDFALELGELNLKLQDRLLGTGFSLRFDDGSLIQGQAEMTGVGSLSGDLESMGLSGRAEIEVGNLDFLAPLSDYYVQPSGQLAGTLTVDGTLMSPVVGGNLALENGTVDIPEFGVTLENVRLEITGQEGQLNLEARVNSGPGEASVNGSLRSGEQGVEGQLSLTGTNLLTARLPEYTLETNPDLNLIFTHESAKLTGSVHVPKANIVPENMVDAINISDDVIYIDEVGEKEQSSGYSFSTNLNVTLGEDVQLEGYGISGKLKGSLQVSQEPGEQMRGQGQISLVEGLFVMYGKQLTLERSRLIFGGGPVYNPGIDVRAQKRVVDNKRPSESLEVGVEIGGTVEDMEVQLFSNPTMEEKDILAYMVVGRAMSDVGEQDSSLLGSAAMAMGMDDQLGGLGELTGLLPVDEVFLEGEEEGEMAVVVGKHLTKELFVGYGHNFFDQEGELRLRYDLGRGFSIETRSTGERTGADLLYSFER